MEQHPASTGKVFSAKKIRTYEETEKHPKLIQRIEVINDNYENIHFESKMCDKWGVLTTISSPTEAVRRFFYKPDWCIVVVGDSKKPEVILQFIIK